MGVYPINRTDNFDLAWKSLEKIIKEQIERRNKWNLTDFLILQPEINTPGAQIKNRSMQLLIDRDNPDMIQVVGLSYQLNGVDGYSYAGNIDTPITPETVEPLGEAMIDLVNNIKKNCTEPTGFIMCDFFERDGEPPILYDPGLRTTASTPASAAKLWLSENYGVQSAVTCFTMLEFKEPNLQYSEVVKRLEKYGYPDSIVKEGYGVLPYGHNPKAGTANVMLVTPTAEDFDEFYTDLKARLGI